MAVDEDRSASQTFLDQDPRALSPSLPKLLPDEDKALSIGTSATAVLPKRHSYYVSSAERDGRLWEDWGRGGEILNVRPVKKLRRVLWWQFASENQEHTTRRTCNVISPSLRGVGARRKVMTYVRNLLGGMPLKSID